MIDENKDENKDQNLAEFRAERTSPALPRRTTEADTNPINPYQAPAYHPDEVDDDTQRDTQADPGAAFWITAAVLVTLGFLTVGFAGGLALPLPFALMGGIVRASVMFTRQRDSAYARSPAIVLLLTSIFVTLLLMFCSAIAFVTICTGGVIATGGQNNVVGIGIWTMISALAALFAFGFMFYRSLKWGV